jgi:hypothetical protein
MTTVATVRLLVKEISSLSLSLADTVPKGSKDDKIWSVMNAEERDSPHETFNSRFDALFAEDCRDADGRLHHVRQGKLGMGLVVSYISKITWADFPLDIVELKLQRLIAELKYLQYVFIFCCPLFILIVFRRADVPRPSRALNLTAKLKDAANASAPELSFQRKAVEDFHSRLVQAPQPSQPTASIQTRQVPLPTEDNQPPTSSPPDSLVHARTSATEPTLQKKRSVAIITDDDSDGDGTEKVSKQRMYFPNLKPNFDI